MYIRMLLEVGSMERVAGRLAADRARYYEGLVDRMRELAEVRTEKNVAAFLDISRDFHLGLIGELGMPRLTELIAQMRAQPRRRPGGRQRGTPGDARRHRPRRRGRRTRACHPAPAEHAQRVGPMTAPGRGLVDEVADAQLAGASKTTKSRTPRARK